MLIRKAFEHKNAAKNKKRVEFRNCVEETNYSGGHVSGKGRPRSDSEKDSVNKSW